MLHGMTTLVGCHSGSGYATRLVDLAAEVDGMVRRVVVVGQAAFDAGNLNIVDAVGLEHLLGYIATSHAAHERFFGEVLELTVQVGLNDVADQRDTDEYNPD